MSGGLLSVGQYHNHATCQQFLRLLPLAILNVTSTRPLSHIMMSFETGVGGISTYNDADYGHGWQCHDATDQAWCSAGPRRCKRSDTYGILTCIMSSGVWSDE